jgi:hypothetical protein
MAATQFKLEVTGTIAVCPIGEVVGEQNIREGATPVLSCEGACIRGEIARLAANRVAKESGYRRACHGELFSVPHSAMAKWVQQAGEVVVIDGCHLKCHGRMVEPLVTRERLRSFDALAHYRKYSDVFDIEAVPESERQEVAADVAEWVIRRLNGSSGGGEAESRGGGEGPASAGCCG